MRNDLKIVGLNSGCLKIFGCLSTSCIVVKNSSFEDTGTWIHVPDLPLNGICALGEDLY